MSLNDVKIGDRVRITYEGPVTDKNGYSIWIGGVDLTTYTYLHPTVEILEPAKPPIKVGDVIPPDVTPTDLPEGTVLLTDNGIPWRLHEGAWRTHFHTGVKPSEFWAPYFRSSLLTVVYLP